MYLPRYNFGPTTDEIDTLQCMACKFWSKPDPRLRRDGPSLPACDGCVQLEEIEGILAEDSEFWEDGMRDERGPLLGDPLEFEDDAAEETDEEIYK